MRDSRPPGDVRELSARIAACADTCPVDLRATEDAVEIRLGYAEARRLWSGIQVGTELSRAEYYIRTGLSKPNVARFSTSSGLAVTNAAAMFRFHLLKESRRKRTRGGQGPLADRLRWRSALIG